MRKTGRSSHRGFTLIEMLVVVGIIGILIGIVGVALISQLNRAKTRATKGQIQTLKLVLNQYKSDLGAYPPSISYIEALEEGLGASIKWHGPYLKFEKGQLGEISSGQLVNQANTPMEFYDGGNAVNTFFLNGTEVYLDQFDRPIVYIPFREYATLGAAQDENESYYNPTSFQAFSFGRDGRAGWSGGNVELFPFDDRQDNDGDGEIDEEDNLKTSPNRSIEDDITSW